MGFDASDTNLFRYVGNNPSNQCDPMGTAVAPPTIGKSEEEIFFLRLTANNERQRVVINKLRRHPRFIELWTYARSRTDMKLVVDRLLPAFGMAEGNTRLILNPMHPQSVENPMELADTLIHETLHVVLFNRRLSEASVAAGSVDPQ